MIPGAVGLGGWRAGDSTCESCGREGGVLCDGFCRECVEWDYVFDEQADVWLTVDRHGECDDCDRDAALFSIGDGLVCLGCRRRVQRRRAAA